MSLTLGKPWWEDIVELYCHTLRPSSLVTTSFTLGALLVKGTLFLLCTLRLYGLNFKHFLHVYLGAISLSLMGGQAFSSELGLGSGGRDHILGKVMAPGRRPCPSSWPLVPPWWQGQRGSQLRSAEVCGCKPRQGSGQAPPVPPSLAVQLASAFVCRTPGPLHCAGASGRRWQLWTLSPHPQKSSEGFPLWVYKSPLSNSWLRELSSLADFLSHILNNFSAIHYVGKQVLFVLILSLGMQLLSARFINKTCVWGLGISGQFLKGTKTCWSLKCKFLPLAGNDSWVSACRKWQCHFQMPRIVPDQVPIMRWGLTCGSKAMATCHFSKWQQKGGPVMNMVTAWGGKIPPRWQYSYPQLSRAPRQDQTVQAPGHTYYRHYENSAVLPPQAGLAEWWAGFSTQRKGSCGQWTPSQRSW